MKPTAAVAVLDPDLKYVLLIRRADEPFKGLLGFPGGKLGAQESFLEAAKRELREEAGIEVGDWAIVNSYHADGIVMVVFTATAPITTQPTDGSWIEVASLSRTDTAPNVALATVHACEVAARRGAFAAYVDASNAVDRLGTLLVSSVRSIDRQNNEPDVGWDHYLQRKRIGTVGTAFGLMALHEVGISLNPTLHQNIVDTLLSREHADGGWGVRSMELGGSPGLVHSTCYVLDALRVSGCSKDHPAVSRGLAWLVKNQQQDGGWGMQYELPSRVLPTTLALRTLTGWDKVEFNRPIASAATWLRRAQNDDGGWGVRAKGSGYPLESSTVHHTSRAISALIYAGESIRSRELVEARNWLLGHFPPNLTDVASEAEHIRGDQYRLEFKHTLGCLALTALLDIKDPVDNAFMVTRITRLVQTSDLLPNLLADGLPIWETHDRIVVFRRYIQSFVGQSSSIAEGFLDASTHAVSGLWRSVESYRYDQAVNPAHDALILSIHRYAEQRVSFVRYVIAFGFAIALAGAAPLVFGGWDKLEPLLTIVTVGGTGLIAILGFRVSAQSWLKPLWRRLEQGYVKRIAGTYGGSSFLQSINSLNERHR